MINVTVFVRVSNTLNPYILLFKETLERQGISVNLKREFNLNWLLSNGKCCNYSSDHRYDGVFFDETIRKKIRFILPIILAGLG